MQGYGHKTRPSGVLECWSNAVVVTPNTDAFAKPRKLSFSVIPAEAGIQEHQGVLDPGFRRGDGREAFCEAINTDGFVKSHRTAFRSWFDTSPRTENQMITSHPVRSPCRRRAKAAKATERGIEGRMGFLRKPWTLIPRQPWSVPVT